MLVDELGIDADERQAVARPVLYAFDSPQLVSTRRTPSSGRAGPVGILEEGTSPSPKSFPERYRHLEGRRSAISYVEPWTVPAWTLYVLFPPAEFFASTRGLHDTSDATSPELVPASLEDRLFYFALFGHAITQHSFRVEARFERDPREVERLLTQVEFVKGRQRWVPLRDSLKASAVVSGAIASGTAAVKSLFGL